MASPGPCVCTTIFSTIGTWEEEDEEDDEEDEEDEDEDEEAEDLFFFLTL